MPYVPESISAVLHAKKVVGQDDMPGSIRPLTRNNNNTVRQRYSSPDRKRKATLNVFWRRISAVAVSKTAIPASI